MSIFLFFSGTHKEIALTPTPSRMELCHFCAALRILTQTLESE